MTRIKICCMATLDEARMAIAHGASAVGLVSRMPSGPGPIEESVIAEIIPHVPRGIDTFLLTSETDAEAIAAQWSRLRPTTLQLVDRLDRGDHRDLRRALPGVKLVQVIHVHDDASVEEARAVAPFVDAILLDSGNQRLAVKELGGTGRTHDWAVSRRIRETVKVPVWLAGGLNGSNVAAAIRAVEPYGVDVCSGVRTDGRLDAAKLKAFVSAV